jgi:hypothetical protein
VQPRHVWSSSATAVVVGLAAMIFPHCRIGLFICGEHGRRYFHDLCPHDPAFLVLLCAAGSVSLRTVAATSQPPAADLSTQSLPKPPEVPVMTMVRGTLASHAEVTSWPTLRSPSPRPNPQMLRVVARDLLVVARDLTGAG